MLLQATGLPFLRHTFAGVTLGNYIWFAALVLLTFVLKKPVSVFFARLISGIATRLSGGRYGRLFRSLVRRPLEGLFTAIMLFAAFNHLVPLLSRIVLIHFQRQDQLLEVTLADLIDHIFLFTAILFFTLTLSRIIDFIYRTQAELAAHRKEREKLQLFPLVKDVAKVLLWSVAFFCVLGIVFHVNIPALITGLGIGGVAIALAAKESIENLFASFTILADKPFQADDTIRLGSLEGKVERIGFRSTQLRNADGSLYIIPNKKLVNENLENLTQRDTRGVKVVINIKYGVPPETLERLVTELKTMVRRTLHVTQPVQVALENFNESVFQLIISYHLPQLMSASVPEIKQQINMKAYAIVMKHTGQQAAVATDSEPDVPEEKPPLDEPEEEADPGSIL